MTTVFPPGAPCWADIHVPRTDTAAAFYAAVLDWEITSPRPEFGGYATANANGAVVAGIGPMMGASITTWTLYFASDDAEVTQEAVLDAGGDILAPVHAVGDLGRLLLARDPTGAAFGVWQGQSMAGFDAPGTTGSFAWCDLRSPDPDAARRFYASVFGFAYQAVPMAGPDYATFATEGGSTPLGGIGPMMGSPEGTSSHWLLYFAVASADVAHDRAIACGGGVLAAPFDTPFGRMAPLTDPFGAPFWAVQLPG